MSRRRGGSDRDGGGRVCRREEPPRSLRRGGVQRDLRPGGGQSAQDPIEKAAAAAARSGVEDHDHRRGTRFMAESSWKRHKERVAVLK